MKNFLPLGKPLVNSFPQHAHIFSITGAQSNNYIPWVYNCFVQMYARANFNNGLRLEYAIPDPYTRILGITRDIISRELALEAWDGIINFVRSYINHGYYIYGMFDVSQIAAYEKNDYFTHNPLLYGYDDEKKEIYFADNYGNGSYSTGVATYQEIIAATEELHRHQGKISGRFSCLQYNANDFRFKFEKELYRDLLIDYLEQKDSYCRWLQPGFVRKPDDHRYWGIGIYSLMQNYLDYMLQEDFLMDKRGFYMQKEHKNLLLQSITYVLGNNWKNTYPLEYKLLEDNVRISNIMLNLCLKYNITHDSNIPDKIRDYLITIERNEKDLFPRLIRCVEETNTIAGCMII